MEQKKTEKANLLNKVGLHFSIGLLVTMCIVVMAFEYRKYDRTEFADMNVSTEFEELLEIPPTEQPPPPPPKIRQPEIVEVPDEEE
ncbi:MAG: energy transducer TonB, partial [Cyclobacteriaceae bacterium]